MKSLECPKCKKSSIDYVTGKCLNCGEIITRAPVNIYEQHEQELTGVLTSILQDVEELKEKVEVVDRLFSLFTEDRNPGGLTIAGKIIEIVKVILNDKTWREYFCRNYYVRIENPIDAINCETCSNGPYNFENESCKTCRDKVFKWKRIGHE